MERASAVAAVIKTSFRLDGRVANPWNRHRRRRKARQDGTGKDMDGRERTGKGSTYNDGKHEQYGSMKDKTPHHNAETEEWTCERGRMRSTAHLLSLLCQSRSLSMTGPLSPRPPRSALRSPFPFAAHEAHSRLEPL